jgi:hypothetical protein
MIAIDFDQTDRVKKVAEKWRKIALEHGVMRIAALNNAALCAAVCRVHGISYERKHGLWFSTAGARNDPASR